MSDVSGILIMLHCEQNTGYAIGKLESVFKKAALMSGFDEGHIYWSFSKVNSPAENVFTLKYNCERSCHEIREIVDSFNIRTVLAFDLQYPSKIAAVLNGIGGIKLISYWGASMSGLNSGFKLFMKKIEWYFKRNTAANFFIFESEAMRLSAAQGRGVPVARTGVIPLGVDVDVYKPGKEKKYIKKELNIPPCRKVIFYSGHMEERKGIRTIVKAARYLAETGRLDGVHFVLCGNKGAEADTYLEEVRGTKAIEHVTFAGYRNDVPLLMRSSDLGVIASTGWDSFTRSSVEMLASGLPLVVSNTGGLAETTVSGETGDIVEPGDHKQLAEKIFEIMSDSHLCDKYSVNARSRAIKYFTESEQISRLANILSMSIK